jgi:type IV pilus assembly protein PilB
MGIEPFLVSSTVNMILAQRLVRKLCQKCITSYNLTKEEVLQLEKNNGINITELSNMFAASEKDANKDRDLSSILFFKGKGCNKCGNSGYKGRLGIYETLDMTEDIKHLVASRATAEEIQKKAKEKGMISMLEDGFLKAKSGVTSIEEILRVTKE